MYLHGNREVSLGLRGEVDINGFLGECLVALRWSANFNDVKLGWWREIEMNKSMYMITRQRERYTM